MQGKPKKLVFENGVVFTGKGFGADTETLCEVVFNTSMVGYQEIYSDCGYNAQMVCMTYPLIGNYGMADEDYETRIPRMGGFIVREYNDSLANFRATKTLAEDMEEHGIPGIEGLDTRRITRMLRDEGSMRAMLCQLSTSNEEAMERLKTTPLPHSQVADVSSKKRWYVRAAGAKYNVAAIDCGIRLSLLKQLAGLGCNVTVLPYDATPETILSLGADGLLLSGGPGNPEDVEEVVETVRALRGRLPMFGACLGHQIVALASGCKTFKLKFGHRGGNHPVKDMRTGKIETTSQNHGYAVDANSVKGSGLRVTHLNLQDDTVEGLEDTAARMFGVQYHPESYPGARDAATPFEAFIHSMAQGKKGGNAHA